MPTRKRIFLVPHAHYDVVWAMNRQDYLNIFKMLLRRTVEMIRNDGFKFLIEQTHLLEQIESEDPDLFLALEKAIHDGDVEIVDGQYLMPDPMIPCEEVLVREILHGNLYSKEKFGVDVPVAWASDGFGLNAQMPQIYRKSGYRWLAFRRGLPKYVGSRVSEFIWEGLDGSQIPCHWMPLGYRAGLDMEKWEETHGKLEKLATTGNVLMPCGSGGMMVQDDIPENVRNWNRTHDDVEMILSTPRAYFEALEKDGLPRTVYKGELYSADLEDIFPDVVSSRIGLKLAIRECEDLLVTVEKAAALTYLHGRPYPLRTLNTAWKKMLFLAFHDVVPSCGIDEIYDEAWEYIHDIKALGKKFASDVDALLPTAAPGTGVMVFNPHSWKVSDWVEVDVKLGTGWSTEPGIYYDDKEVVSEARDVERWDDDSIQRAKLGFVATVPPLGYRIYEIKPKSKKFKSKKIKIRDNEVATTYFNLRIDRKTGILEVTDKQGNEILKGNEVVIDAEVGDLYFHRSRLDQCIGSESGDGIRFGVFKPDGLTIERGALRTIITYKTQFYCLRWPYYLHEKFEPMLYRQKTLDLVKKVIVYNNNPRIDFHTELDLKQSHVRVRLRFDTCMATPRYYRETQFGALELPYDRTLHDGAKVPSLTWLSGEDEFRGLAFFTKGVPINEVRGGEIYCTLLRSVSVLSDDGITGPLIPTPGAMELGTHSYHYSILPYENNWQDASVPREAYTFSQELAGFQIDRIPKVRDYGTFVLEPANLIISALKKAEHEEAIILRFFETDGRACKARLKLPAQVVSATLTNLLEEDLPDGKPVTIKDKKLQLHVDPFEIVTLKLQFDVEAANADRLLGGDA
jgi:alpha-mannosidase